MVSPETAAVGDTLSCTMGNWTGEPTEYAYQWLSNGTDTRSATGASYTRCRLAMMGMSSPAW